MVYISIHKYKKRKTAPIYAKHTFCITCMYNVHKTVENFVNFCSEKSTIDYSYRAFIVYVCDFMKQKIL